MNGNTTAETLALVKDALGKPDIMAKSVTTGTGLLAYDLQPSAKNLYPAATPIRNVLPRVGMPGDLALYDLFADEAVKLEKDWHESKHPRWPGGAPGRQGGRFSPNGSGPGASPETQPDRSPGIGHNGGLPLDEPPEIPNERPPTSRLRTAIIKGIARWLIKRGITYLIPGVGEALALLDAASWLKDYLPYIDAFLDKPKTLEELQDLVSEPKEGYEIHHIAEQTAARNDGFTNSEIESPENTVRISTLRHWEITAWYRRGNKDYGGLSPRKYLRGKDWAERLRVGRKALLDMGVLKP